MPDTVDRVTGYRYYGAEQIPTAQVIHRLRELDVPLPEVRQVLRAPDPQARADRLFEAEELLVEEISIDGMCGVY